MRAYAAGLGLALLAGVCSAACAAQHAPAERAPEVRDASPLSALVDAGADAVASDAGGDALEPASRQDPSDAGAVLGGHAQRVELFEGKETLGFVSVPLGAREPRPIMIALHGGSDRPERACAAWRDVTEAYPFVVCPRGFGGNEARLGWRSSADTAERIARAVSAARRLFGPWIKETKTVVLTGFSMGGSQVARLARGNPGTYPRIVVGDSAHEPRPALTFSPAWASGGGTRAIFLCTTSGCEPALRKAARNVAAQNAMARLNIAPTQVHGLSAPVVQSMRRDWAWLVEGAEGWEAYVPPSDASLPGKTEHFPPNSLRQIGVSVPGEASGSASGAPPSP
jgi:dienelactone hydrolase